MAARSAKGAWIAVACVSLALAGCAGLRTPDPGPPTDSCDLVCAVRRIFDRDQPAATPVLAQAPAEPAASQAPVPAKPPAPLKPVVPPKPAAPLKPKRLIAKKPPLRAARHPLPRGPIPPSALDQPAFIPAPSSPPQEATIIPRTVTDPVPEPQVPIIAGSSAAITPPWFEPWRPGRLDASVP